MENKIIISKIFLEQLLGYYSKEIYAKFAGYPITTETLDLIQIELINIMLFHRSREPLNQHWYININVVFNKNTNTVEIGVSSPDQLILA